MDVTSFKGHFHLHSYYSHWTLSHVVQLRKFLVFVNDSTVVPHACASGLSVLGGIIIIIYEVFGDEHRIIERIWEN